jgi:hypothetical protein
MLNPAVPKQTGKKRQGGAVQLDWKAVFATRGHRRMFCSRHAGRFRLVAKNSR